MKTFKLLTFLLFATICSYGQTASWLDSRTVTNAEGQQSVSLGNPFLKAGVKLSMPLNAGADFSNNILFGVRFRKDLYSSAKFTLPIVSNTAFSIGGITGNVSDTSGMLNDKGISAGIYPYFTILGSNGLIIQPHFELSARIQPSSTIDLSKKIYKFAGNVELQIPGANANYNTVSAGLFYSSLYGPTDKSTWGLDITSIFSLDARSGILLDYKKSFSGLGLLSLGLLVK
jgi:hypothetical protein